MRMRLLLALAAGLMVGSDPAPDLGEVQSQEIPPGSWWRRAVDGEVWEFGKDGVMRMMDAHDSEFDMQGRYALDLKTDPPQLTFYEAEGTMRAVYRVKGDRLLVCFLFPDMKAPPTRVAYSPYATLHVLKRLK